MSQQPDILSRFSGDGGQRNIVAALLLQRILQNTTEIATRLARVAQIGRYAAGETLFFQDEPSNDIFFILSGEVSVQIHGRQVNTRHAGQHIGEMSAIDVHARRSGSVVALTETITAKIGEPDFAEIASEYPSIWRQLASELGERIRQRGTSVIPRNAVPKMFIGSSREGLAIARAIQSGLQHDGVLVRVWTDSVFQASRSTIEDLETEVRSIDFGVLVMTHDDQIESRGMTQQGPRDNVVFELGLIMGAIGRNRTFFVQPRGSDMKIPSDLFGIRPVPYAHASGANLAVAIAPVCNELRDIITRLGPK